ncbi:1-acyl-sn-glycerol-3-phosphate acyltransferase [Mycobacterium lepromatosis]|uniref:1-acyl-sn-glycerol-3-phosphate acyltransferase n=1 Tax=Mycobacterium lepromatosis TaxID=480418 RepID=UPI000AACD199|nr:1-acyl-sn-glycerol-3-phosphate acyltransferase [Mycobacterium lepromatosis]
MVNSLIKYVGTILVGRCAGAGTFAVVVQRLCMKGLLGLYPEATITSSLELEFGEFKTGVARMVVEAVKIGAEGVMPLGRSRSGSR